MVPLPFVGRTLVLETSPTRHRRQDHRGGGEGAIYNLSLEHRGEWGGRGGGGGGEGGGRGGAGGGVLWGEHIYADDRLEIHSALRPKRLSEENQVTNA